MCAAASQRAAKVASLSIESAQWSIQEPKSLPIPSRSESVANRCTRDKGICQVVRAQYSASTPRACCSDAPYNRPALLTLSATVSAMDALDSRMDSDPGELSISQVQARGPSGLDVPPACVVGYHCPLRGTIRLPAEVQPFLQTHAFVRLKNLKQLGVCSMVRLAPLWSLSSMARDCAEAWIFCRLHVHS
jgi:hypothetical protein